MNEIDLRSRLNEAFPSHETHADIHYIPRGGKVFTVQRAEGKFNGVELWRVSCHKSPEHGEMEEIPEAWFEMPAEAVIPTVKALLPPQRAEVRIPGMVVCTWVEGKITDMAFTPHAGDAGYRGPAADLWDGDPLDVEDTEGPFWTAVQSYLASDHNDIDWRE